MIFPLILLVLSSATHFLFFGHPHAVVFDEVYNGSFISSYSSGSYYFDIHPPLAKLLMKFFADFLGTPYNVDFSTIGNILPWGVIMLRLLPMIAGTLLPMIIYFICRRLNLSKIASFTAGALIILENSLLVQSRFILFDSIMILFGFSAILLYLIYIKNESRKSLLVFSAILAACAFSIKWTGLAFPLLIFFTEIVRVKKIKECLKFFAVYAVVGLTIYLSVFAIHFAYLDRTGPGDLFMTDRFQKTLIGNPLNTDSTLKTKGFFGKFIELNVEMYDANKTLTKTHDYSSRWYSWPLMIRSVFYFEGKHDDSGNSYIYLLGNPLIYWLGFLSIVALCVFVVEKRKELFRHKVILFILVGFFVNWLPFIFIGRVMFLYHYESALVFSIIALGFWIDRMPHKKLITSILLSLCLLAFIFFSPLSYGLHLTDSGLNARMWLSAWR